MTLPLVAQSEPFWSAAAIGLALDAAARGILVLAAAAIAVLCLRKASAAVRHLVWFLAISSLLFLPALALLPGWHALPAWMRLAPDRGPLSMSDSGGTLTGAIHLLPASPAGSGAGAREGVPAGRFAGPSPAAPAGVLGIRVPSRFLFIWAAGSALALVPAALGTLSLRRLGRASGRVVDRTWLELLQHLTARLGMKRKVILLRSSRRGMPMTWGWIRPKLLLPEESEGWPEERRRLVLLHELAHVKRLDYLTHLIAQLACALYWFNPLAWMAARRMVVERERACDDLVLGQGWGPAEYAGQVLEIASGLRGAPRASWSAIAMARPTRLEVRLLAILDDRRARGAVTRPVLAASIIILSGVALPLAMLRARPGSVPGRALRVLYLEGTPRWEYRYLKNALIRDRRIEAQIFLHGAGPDFAQESSPGLPPLKAAPRTLAELEGYDAVILGDVPPETLRSGDPQLARLLANYVRTRGGGLVALAGERFPAIAEIEEILPVRFILGVRGEAPSTPVLPRLTEDGKQSEVLKLGDGPGENSEIWEKRLPGVHAWRRDVEAKASSDVLAEIPGEDGSGSRIPIYVSWQAGKGKTFFVGTDESWRWRAGADNLYFYRFWSQVLRHVARPED